MPGNQFLEAALSYAEAGVRVFPVQRKKKLPHIKQWQDLATIDEGQITDWWTKWPNANIGIHVGKSELVVLDIDPRNGGNESLEKLLLKYGKNWTPHICVTTGDGGLHYYFFDRGEGNRIKSPIARGIDIQYGNKYVVAPPSIHPNGTAYKFEGAPLSEGELVFLLPAPDFIYQDGVTDTQMGDGDWALTCAQTDPETPENVKRVSTALKCVSADCSREEWRNILFSILSTGWSCAVELARGWSMTAPQLYEESAFLNIVKSAKSDRPKGITLGTLFALATQNGWIDPRKTKGRLETYGDISNGRRLAERYRGRLLYVHASKVWFAWQGERWTQCDNGEAMAAAKAIADECIGETVAALKDDPTETAKRNHTQALGVHRSIHRLEAMLQSAASEPGMSIAHPGLMDADPWTLGVQNGVLNLTTGHLLQGSPEMRISRQAGAPYHWDAECPRWTKFLHEAMCGDAGLVNFLQRVCGYALTGLVDEEKLFFMHGTGANGKSVFANVISAAMGQYTVTVRSALLARDPKGGSGDAEREKARLPGTRLATVNETGLADVFDDQRVKEITSRERISARQLYGESFDFMPTHKLFIRGNHQPGAMDGSDGFWRRIVLIGFTRQFKESERVLDLDRQIIDHELPGVLAWMVKGCLEWQKAGLQVPASVAAAVDTYRHDTDLLGEWIDARCIHSTGSETALSELFTSYERFLKEANTKAPSRNSFGRQLAQRGFTKRKSNGVALYKGLKVRNPFDEADDETDEEL